MRPKWANFSSKETRSSWLDFSGQVHHQNVPSGLSQDKASYCGRWSGRRHPDRANTFPACSTDAVQSQEMGKV